MDSNYDILSSIMAPTKSESIIMVLGVGGAGGNAVNHMFDLGIKDVTFMVCNTDQPRGEQDCAGRGPRCRQHSRPRTTSRH